MEPPKSSTVTIEELWEVEDFKPNDNQREAIKHIDGPLYLPAGPGSGKTRVLLWRTLNLIVFQAVKPEEIFLATFTEKAALQLKEGLRTLLGMASSRTGKHYDIAKMYVGTVHSLCRRMMTDRRFSVDRRRGRVPVLLDAVDQYFYVSQRRNLEALLGRVGLEDDEESYRLINTFFEENSSSKFNAIQNCLKLFNRFSEECVEPEAIRTRTDNEMLRVVIDLYEGYLELLERGEAVPHTDLSLVQQMALRRLNEGAGSEKVFKHVIVDEYQDTNTIQERLYFKLADGHKNLCVVGDDDQALYRFRGATVENFVEFKERCERCLGVAPVEIPLATNYRSRKRIVDFYTDFIGRCRWEKEGQPGQFYRVMNKDVKANSKDEGPAVVVTNPGKPGDIFGEIAGLVRELVDRGKVQDPNQIAFLFPSLKNQGQMATQVARMKEALEAKGFKIYAPRAGRFLEVEEATAMFGLFFQVLGKPKQDERFKGDYEQFHKWMGVAKERARELMAADPLLKAYVEERKAEIQTVIRDYEALVAVAQTEGWDLSGAYDMARMKRALVAAVGLSSRAKRLLSNQYFDRVVLKRIEDGEPPFPLRYVINRATSLDWNVLDLFYRLCGFRYFMRMFELAEIGEDEGPVCNLSLISQQLARFVDGQISLIKAEALANGMFVNVFAMRYLYGLYRMGEAEYEDEEDPFPKGRIPFLTIHQAKGLEFPVVVLPNLRKDVRKAQFVERTVRPLLDREGEPLDLLPRFDIMRQFYVGLSRAKHLMILGHLSGTGQRMFDPFKDMLNGAVERIEDFDVETVPVAVEERKELPKNYSYTADYLLYQKCPRQYMLFRKYRFAASSTETMVFGSVIHQTLEDLHQYLIGQRRKAA